MRVAIISDIHSNYHALKSAIDDIKKQNIDTVIINGDLVTDFPYPNKTIDEILKLNNDYELILLKGNREEYLENIDFNNISSLNASLIYTHNNLSDEYKKLLSSLSYSYIINDIFIAHSSDISTRELFFKDSPNTKEYIDRMNYKMIICGHSHREFSLNYNDKIFINTGPLGHFNNSFTGVYLIIDTITYQYEHRYISYDINQVYNDFIESGLADYGLTYTKCIMDMLKKGYCNASEVINKGLSIAGNNRLEEKYFIEAYKKINGS